MYFRLENQLFYEAVQENSYKFMKLIPFYSITKIIRMNLRILQKSAIS